jgi:DNA-binding PadR family transcriptional regulator
MSSPLTARAATLQLLLDSPAYGAELIARFARRAGGGAHLTPARIYPVLKALAAEGLVTTVRVAPRGRRGARTRVYYVLTREGRTAAEADRSILETLIGTAAAHAGAEAAAQEMADRLLEAEALTESSADLAAASG